ncbi:MAG: dihydroorotase, partial [SAR202 cluster bacterium]|nr:dihydroorotase [SAR202 cluster bacterium]
MKNSLLLRDFRLFDPSEKLDKISDILIEDGKITKIDEFIDISNVEIIQGN